MRPTLVEFADAMELKLQKNDHKRGWRELPLEALERLMKIELEEYAVAREFLTVDDARKELVDVANFCMMLWDRLEMIEQESASGRQK